VLDDDQQVETWLQWQPTGEKSKQKLGGDAAHGRCSITL
jgi:hypothetical protein